MTTIRKTYQASETKAAEGTDRSLIVTISTSSPDRSNDIVVPSGVILDNYLKNPVVAFAHRYDGLAVAKASDVQVQPDKIIAKVTFPDAGISELSDQIYALYKDGFMNAWSIGFLPKEITPRDQGGRQFDQWELLEFSAVMVPDNAEALTIMRSKGIEPEKMVKEIEELEQKEVEAAKEGEEPTKSEGEGEDPKPEGEQKPEGEEKPAGEEKPKEGAEEPKAVDWASVEEKGDEFLITFKIGEQTLTAKATKELFEKLALEAEKKEGRVLSEKNRGLVKSVIDSMSETIKALQALYDATDSGKSEGGKTLTETQIAELKEIQKALRGVDVSVGVQLRAIRTYLRPDNSIREGGDI